MTLYLKKIKSAKGAHSYLFHLFQAIIFIDFFFLFCNDELVGLEPLKQQESPGNNI